MNTEEPLPQACKRCGDFVDLEEHSEGFCKNCQQPRPSRLSWGIEALLFVFSLFASQLALVLLVCLILLGFSSTPPNVFSIFKNTWIVKTQVLTTAATVNLAGRIIVLRGLRERQDKTGVAVFVYLLYLCLCLSYHFFYEGFDSVAALLASGVGVAVLCGTFAYIISIIIGNARLKPQ